MAALLYSIPQKSHKLVHQPVQVAALLLGRTAGTAVAADVDGLERSIELVQFFLRSDVLRELGDELGPYPVAG